MGLRALEPLWKAIMRIQSLKVLVLAGLLALGGSGCVLFVAGAVAAGVGTYAYINGESKENEAASLDRTWNATQAAMKDMQFAVITQAKDAWSGELTARNSADKKITISLKRLSETVTEIRVRVGTFGDEAQSRMILEKIRNHL
jgi:hypothetical protein